jgi:hypothetical protein
LPGWAWFSIAFVAAISITVRAEWKSYQDKHAKIEPDMPLANAVARIIGSSDLFGGDNPNKTDAALLSLAEKAHLGLIKIWGRRDVSPRDYERTPRIDIPQAYWDEFATDMAVLKDVRGRTWRMRGQPKTLVVPSGVGHGNFKETVPDKIYGDLYFSKVEIDRIWPAPKARIRWQFPFRRTLAQF